VSRNQHAILDSTAHHLKFIGFQQMYFDNNLPPEFEITPKPELANQPRSINAPGPSPQPGQPLYGEELSAFVEKTALTIAHSLDLRPR
jgi:threonine synthase